MAWTTPADHAASVVSVSEWNSFHGAAGNCKFLKDAVDTNAAAIQSPMKAQQNGGAVIGGRNKLNLIAGANVTVTVADDSANDRINVTLAASGSSSPTQGAASGVVSLSAPSTAFEKGSWVELIASTSFAATHIAIGTRGGAASGIGILVDIGTGSAGSEIVKIPNLLWYSYNGSAPVIVPFAFASASRIAARAAQTSGTGATATISVTILG